MCFFKNLTVTFLFVSLVEITIVFPPAKHALGEGGVQSTLFCIFNHCYFSSSPKKLKICHRIKQPYTQNIMTKHENNAFQKKFYN